MVVFTCYVCCLCLALWVCCLCVRLFVVARGFYFPVVVFDCMLNDFVCVRVAFVTLLAFALFDVCVCCLVFAFVCYCLF